MQRLAVVVLTGVLIAHVTNVGSCGDGRWTPMIVVVPPPVVVVAQPMPAAQAGPVTMPATLAGPSQPSTTQPSTTPPPPTAVDLREGLGPCPAPYRKATDVALAQPLDLDVRGMIASAYDVRLLAAWSDEAIALSVDEGRTWTKVLADAASIQDALFDCHGRLHVIDARAQLGTYDDALAEADRERWTPLASLGGHSAKLAVDGGGVAVIGDDVADDTRLVLVRRDARGRWRAAPLMISDDYGSWDGIDVVELEPLAGGRFRMLAMPWQGGECGYSRYVDVTFDLGLGHLRVVPLGEELSGHWKRADDDGSLPYEIVTRDRAGRWIVRVMDVDDDAAGSSDDAANDDDENAPRVQRLVRVDRDGLASLRAPADE
jgi:hypothetical protein